MTTEPAVIGHSNEITPEDYWRWRAHLDGGLVFDEYDASGQGHSWLEVDPHQVCTIELVPQEAGRPPIMLEVPVGARAWVERRRSLRLHMETGQVSNAGTVTVVRWEHPVGTAVWVFARDDGLVAVSHRDAGKTEGE